VGAREPLEVAESGGGCGMRGRHKERVSQWGISPDTARRKERENAVFSQENGGNSFGSG
jgi:hypothetical protein